MKNNLAIISTITALAILLNSCSVVASIFKAGMNFGIIIVVVIIIAILVLVFRSKSNHK